MKTLMSSLQVAGSGLAQAMRRRCSLRGWPELPQIRVYYTNGDRSDQCWIIMVTMLPTIAYTYHARVLSRCHAQR